MLTNRVLGNALSWFLSLIGLIVIAVAMWGIVNPIFEQAARILTEGGAFFGR